MKVGIFVVATGKYYSHFFEKFYKSCEEYFLKGIEKTYYVITDTINTTSPPENVITIYQRWEPFPFPTLNRYKYIHGFKGIVTEDYLFYIDVDSLFVSEVKTRDIHIGSKKSFISVIHPGFWNTSNPQGTPERNEASKAYIPTSENRYVCGGFQGGRRNSFLKAIEIMKNAIETDESNGIIPIWHDESIWNKFVFLNKKNVEFISPEMCFPQNAECINPYLSLIKNPKLIALDKNKTIVRNPN